MGYNANLGNINVYFCVAPQGMVIGLCSSVASIMCESFCFVPLLGSILLSLVNYIATIDMCNSFVSRLSTRRVSSHLTISDVKTSFVWLYLIEKPREKSHMTMFGPSVKHEDVKNIRGNTRRAENSRSRASQ